MTFNYEMLALGSLDFVCKYSCLSIIISFCLYEINKHKEIIKTNTFTTL